MMPLHDTDLIRSLEREIRDSAERARRIREARSAANGAFDPEPQERPVADVTELKPSDDGCALCELDRREHSA